MTAGAEETRLLGILRCGFLHRFVSSYRIIRNITRDLRHSRAQWDIPNLQGAAENSSFLADQ